MSPGGERTNGYLRRVVDSELDELIVGLPALVRDTRHLKWLQGQIGDTLLDAILITTGEYAYRRKDGIAIVPAALLGP
jgi:uncharacterized protein